MKIPSFASYLNPCSKEHQASKDFKTLSVDKKIATVFLTMLTSIASWFMLGFAGVAVFRLCVNNWKKISPQKPAVKPQEKTAQKVDQKIQNTKKEEDKVDEPLIQMPPAVVHKLEPQVLQYGNDQVKNDRDLVLLAVQPNPEVLDSAKHPELYQYYKNKGIEANTPIQIDWSKHNELLDMYVSNVDTKEDLKQAILDSVAILNAKHIEKLFDEKIKTTREKRNVYLDEHNVDPKMKKHFEVPMGRISLFGCYLERALKALLAKGYIYSLNVDSSIPSKPTFKVQM